MIEQVEVARHRVLVVDDHPDAAEMICMMVRALGHTCACATNGEDGLRLLAKLRPDIALLDLGLPDLSGYELARRIRASYGGDVYLAAITGWGAAADRERAIQAGFDRHVLKPATRAVLREILALPVRVAV